MITSRPLLLPVVAALALAACGGSDPVSNEANSAALPAPATSETFEPNGTPPQPNSAAPPQPTPANAAAPRATGQFPRALQGRWGMVPEDCTSTRGDAKGLLTIGESDMRFYESRAVPTANVETSENSISADFSFVGEGMSWTKFESLQLREGKLVRTVSSPMASFTYARCD